MEKNIIIELNDFLPRIKTDIRQRFPIISGFLLIMLFLKTFLSVPFSNFLFFLVALMLLTSIFIDFIVDKLREKKALIAINSYFIYVFFDATLLALVIYFLGGITWIVPAVYLFYIINVFWLFPRFQAIFLVIFINLLLILLAFGTYFGIFPYFGIFLPEEKNFQTLF